MSREAAALLTARTSEEDECTATVIEDWSAKEIYKMRWGIGLTLLVVGIVLWIGMFLAYPYTILGVADEQVRPSVARLGIYFALASMVVLSMAAVVVFSETENRRRARAVIFGTV